MMGALALIGEPSEPYLPDVDQEEIAALAALLGAPGVARRLLAHFGSLRAVALAADLELAEAGLTCRRLKLVRAALDVGARAQAAPIVGARLSGAETVAAHFGALLALSPVEEFWACALDVRHRMTSKFLVARGTATGVEVHPREVFRELIRRGAVAAIFCHNHPSGDPSPSRADVDITARLRQVGELCGIAVLDHVVVAVGGLWRSVDLEASSWPG